MKQPWLIRPVSYECNGAELRKARKAKGMKLVELAALVGCSPSFICDLEYGRKTKLNWKMALLIGDALK